MATLRTQDRLQPALLDRLTDDEPLSRTEPVDGRAINRNRLRELVLRDLGWLFNATGPGDDNDWASAPHAARSVLRYGLPISAKWSRARVIATYNKRRSSSISAALPVAMSEGMQPSTTLSTVTAFHSWPLAEWMVDKMR